MTESTHDPSFITRATSDTLSVRKVFGEAYEHDGVLVIPVAKVCGATGSGFGTGSLDHDGPAEAVAPSGDRSGTGSGGGGGFGVRVKPVGVFLVDADGAHWRPALDLNRAILGGQAVGIVVALVAGCVLGRWMRHR
jgi:uncharacterized spore protein YtfJ